MSDAVSSTPPKAVPQPASSRALQAETRARAPQATVQRSSDVMNSSARPATVIDSEKIKQLKDKLDKLESSPTTKQVVGAVVAGFFLGLLSLAATLLMTTIGVVVGSILPGIGTLALAAICGVMTSTWSFGSTIAVCRHILNTDHAQAEAILAFAEANNTSVTQVLKQLGEIISKNDILDSTSTQAVHNLQKKATDLKSFVEKFSEITEQSNPESVQFLQEHARDKEQLQSLIQDLQELNAPITPQVHRTHEYNVGELRRKENILRNLNQYLAQIETSLDTLEDDIRNRMPPIHVIAAALAKK